MQTWLHILFNIIASNLAAEHIDAGAATILAGRICQRDAPLGVAAVKKRPRGGIEQAQVGLGGAWRNINSHNDRVAISKFTTQISSF